MANILELRQRYAAKAKRLHEIVETAEKEDRGLKPEEQTEFDAGQRELEDLEGRISRQEDADNALRFSREADEQTEQRRREQREEQRRGHDGGDPNAPLTSGQRSRAIQAWLSCGRGASAEDLALVQRMGFSLGQTEIDLRIDRGISQEGERFGAPRTQIEVVEQARARRLTRAEQRATNVVGTAALGGNLVPDEMMMPLEKALLAFGGMRSVSTIISTSTGAPLPMPSMNDATVEGVELPEDTAAVDDELAFGQITLGSFKYTSGLIPVSMELIQDSATSIDAIVGEAIGERFGRISNRRFTTGAGTTQPRGITLDSTASGVTTANATAVSYDNVVDLLHSVDPAYRSMASFMTSDPIIAILKKLKDGDLRPLWLPGMAAGEPATILGYPYLVNQHMPTGAGAKAMIFGALNRYHIRDVLGITLMRLTERYAEFGRVTFVAFMRFDGRLRDAGTNPVKHLLLGA